MKYLHAILTTIAQHIIIIILVDSIVVKVGDKKIQENLLTIRDCVSYFNDRCHF